MAKKIARRVLEDIDTYCAKKYDGGFRTHLGASLIGHECSRYLWYTFRWVKHVKHSGQQQRLFNRGHREEARFIEWLEGIGFKVFFEDRESDPLYYCDEADLYCLKSKIEDSSTYEHLSYEIKRDNVKYLKHIAKAKLQGIEFPQYRVSNVGGHFGGSLDGIAYFPESYGIKEPVLLEFKTNGYKSYPKLLKSGMQLAKPQHFAQTSVYGSDKNYNFKYVLYLNINKNDDQIHCELVPLNHNLGEQMVQKAERIITTQIPPERYCSNITMMPCVYCDMKDICYNGEKAEKNCRSCSWAKPIENADWLCMKYAQVIPKSVIKTGCVCYESILEQ